MVGTSKVGIIVSPLLLSGLGGLGAENEKRAVMASSGVIVERLIILAFVIL
jgi:hypothetical protein